MSTFQQDSHTNPFNKDNSYDVKNKSRRCIPRYLRNLSVFTNNNRLQRQCYA